MAAMQPCRLGGELPNNCVFVGETSREVVLATGVEGKVLRMFASPICKRRQEDHRSGAFCWGSESAQGISRRVGKDFMVGVGVRACVCVFVCISCMCMCTRVCVSVSIYI